MPDEQIELIEKHIEMLLTVINNIMIEKEPLLNIPLWALFKQPAFDLSFIV